jgi:hypothetical protein
MQEQVVAWLNDVADGTDNIYIVEAVTLFDALSGGRKVAS